MLYTFGTVLEDKNSYPFIFLYAGDDFYYLAKILTKDRTEELERKYSECSWDPKRGRLPVFDFVILRKTKEYEGRGASFSDPATSFIDGFSYIPTEINKEDLKQIKDEILASNSAPLELQDGIKDINF